VIKALVKAVLGVFGISADESVQFYVDVFLGALSAIALLIVVTLLLARHIDWLFFVAVSGFVACVLIASKKREVTAAALLFVAVRFVVAFFISFQLSALLGVVVCVIAAGMVLGLVRRV
jgi:hypothetical protein